jgi:hypothetical protein
VARVDIARAAQEDVDRLISTLPLPPDTRERIKRALKALERFPHLGPELQGRWTGFRFLIGPWRWLIVVSVHIEELDRVVVVSVQDARSGEAATAGR